MQWILLLVFSTFTQAEWKVDFSRRQKDMLRIERERQAAREEKKPFVKQVFEKDIPTEKVVLLNTEKGFLPQTLRLKMGQNYEVSVVNVNQQQKNVSFMLDAFQEHHGTYFGDVVQFEIQPKKEGLFKFFSPEVEHSGQVLVYAEKQKLDAVPPIKIRQPASVKKEIKHDWVRAEDGGFRRK